MPQIQYSLSRRFGSFSFVMVPEHVTRKSTEQAHVIWLDLFRKTRRADGIVNLGGQKGLPELFRTMGEPRVTPNLIEQTAREFVGKEIILSRAFEFQNLRFSMNGIIDSQAYIRGDDRGALLMLRACLTSFCIFCTRVANCCDKSNVTDFANVTVQFEHCMGFTLHFTGMYRLSEVRVAALKVKSDLPQFMARMDLFLDEFPEGIHGAFDRIMVELFRWFGLPVHIGAVDENWHPYLR